MEITETLFDEHSAEYLRFENIPKERRLHHRPDINAFLILDSLDLQDRDIVCGASHDEIYLDTDIQKIQDKISEEQIIDLIRCGVQFDGSGFLMFA